MKMINMNWTRGADNEHCVQVECEWTLTTYFCQRERDCRNAIPTCPAWICVVCPSPLMVHLILVTIQPSPPHQLMMVMCSLGSFSLSLLLWCVVWEIVIDYIRDEKWFLRLPSSVPGLLGHARPPLHLPHSSFPSTQLPQVILLVSD